MFSFHLPKFLSTATNVDSNKDVMTVAPDNYLNADVWALVCCHLEPWFLHSVLLTSKRLYRAATSDTHATHKLKKYFPMVDLKCTEGEAPNPRRLFHLFAATYKERFFTNPLAKKFAACVLENDIEELKKLPFSKDLLDESMLVIINRQNNQKLRDEIFKIAMADYKKSLPLSTYLSNGFASILKGSEVIPAMNDKMYVVAAALNQLDVVTGVSPKYQPQGYFPTYPESYALKYAVMFDHVEMVGFLINDDMQYSEKGDLAFNRYPIVDIGNPLIMAVRNNSVKIVELILQRFGDQICPQQISNSICIASAAGNAELVAILVACGKPVDSLPSPLELASVNGHVAVLDVLLANNATLFPSQDESALQRYYRIC